MAGVTRNRSAWLALGALGTAILIPFDSPVTIALGVVLLLAFVAWGIALIASPAFTVEDDGTVEDAQRRTQA
jgi:hypothetical protein